MKENTMLTLKYYLVLLAMIIKTPTDYSINPPAQAASDAYHAILYVDAMEAAIKEHKAAGK
jgi:hypothetical protein